MAAEHIVHSIPPTYDERSRVLVLGSLPSPASRDLGFNYGHPRNRFWQVMAYLADEPLPSTNERKRDFCLRHHIALWDVVAECDIEGASDASIRNAKPNDLALITGSAPVEAVFCTGAKSFELYWRLGCEEATGLPAIKLPSTSPANAACGFGELESAYAQIFEHTHEDDVPTLDVPQVVALEKAIDAGGTSLAELMDRAGTALAYRIGQVLAQLEQGAYARKLESQKGTGGLPVTLLCGSGNNGGDGWVAAELLAREGMGVCLVTDKLPDAITAQPAHDAACRAWEHLISLGGTVVEGDGELPQACGRSSECDGSQSKSQRGGRPLILVSPSEDNLASVVDNSQVVVDALLGTGFKHDSVKEPYCTWIRVANGRRGGHITVSADVASGVNAQTGKVSNPCVVADETVTMIVRKPGLEAPECGTVSVGHLAYFEPYLSSIVNAQSSNL